LVHRWRIVALDKMRIPSIAAKQPLQLLVRNPSQQRGIGDLVAIEVKDRQDGAVANRIQKFVAVPRGRQGTGLGLAVTDDAVDDQVGIVEAAPNACERL
jgi:nitrogen-specific signal transduction histidine kinase